MTLVYQIDNHCKRLLWCGENRTEKTGSLKILVPRRNSWVKSGRFGRPEACGNVDNTRGVAHNSTGSTSIKDSVRRFELEGGCPLVAQLGAPARL
jgi:hypothetical protein